MMHGDVCSEPLPEGAFDLVTSWSVFEHLRDPAAAMRNIWRALRPGGVFYIGIHLYTATNGHHDFSRSHTGDDGLPAWAHLRQSTRHLVRPSAYLNEWRVRDWRQLFAEYGTVKEILEDYGAAADGAKLLTPELRAELHGFDEEELMTVDAFYIGKKPHTAVVTARAETSASELLASV
jgi:SAM-dependent methyltransferase